jgi:hypothetical protein
MNERREDGMKTATFIGRASGDGGCFCWRDVPQEIIDRFTPPFKGEHKTSLYPDSVLRRLGAYNSDGSDGLYRFTISVEPIISEPESGSPQQ